MSQHVELKKTLGFWDVFSIALGQVIGSGIMVLIGIGIEFTAYAIPFAFVLSACLHHSPEQIAPHWLPIVESIPLCLREACAGIRRMQQETNEH